MTNQSNFNDQAGYTAINGYTFICDHCRILYCDKDEMKKHIRNEHDNAKSFRSEEHTMINSYNMFNNLIDESTNVEDNNTNKSHDNLVKEHIIENSAHTHDVSDIDDYELYESTLRKLEAIPKADDNDDSHDLSESLLEYFENLPQKLK